MVRVSDLVPGASGRAHLGVDGGPNVGAFDITSIRPFGHIHLVSGVFHDPLYGSSGVVRYNQVNQCLEVSVNGGIGFDCLLTSQSGVLGANGITIEQIGGNFLVDGSALSGIIPSVASGVAVCRSADFTNQTAITLQHNLDGQDVIVQVHDNNGAVVIPDSITLSDANSVDVTFNRPRTGRVVAIGCTSGVGTIAAQERAGFKQGLNPYSFGGSGINIPFGKVHYVDNNGNHRILTNPQEVEIGNNDISQGNFTNNIWYYVYVHASGTSNTLTTSNFDYSSIEPEFDSIKLGWYDPSAGSARRCIGAIQGRGLNFFRDCEVQGNEHRYKASFNVIVNTVSSFTTQDLDCFLPVYSNLAFLFFNFQSTNSVSSLANPSWSTAGFSLGTNNIRLCTINPPVGLGETSDANVHATLSVNSETKQGRLIVGGGTNLTVTTRQYGHIVPIYIGDTPG